MRIYIIDYTQHNLTSSGRQYDLILAVNGFHPLSDYKRALAPGGIYNMAGGTAAQIFQALLLGPWYSSRGGKKFTVLSANANRADLEVLKELLEAGKIAPVIERRYPLSETAEALRYLGQGHARGKVVIII